MTIKEINEYYDIRRLHGEGCYALFDRQKSIYTDYHGSMLYPFIGCIKRIKSRYFFVCEELSTGVSLFRSIAELNELVAEYISKCKSYGITTDCFEPMCSPEWKCRIAVTQFIHNNTELKILNDTIRIGSTTIKLDNKEHQFSICIYSGEDVFMKHQFDKPLEALSYIKSLLKTLLLANVCEPVKNIRKMAATEIKERYDLFENDVLYKADLPTFDVYQIGTLKNQLIGELEEILQQLKSE